MRKKKPQNLRSLELTYLQPKHFKQQIKMKVLIKCIMILKLKKYRHD